jgi:ribonuclease T2
MLAPRVRKLGGAGRALNSVFAGELPGYIGAMRQMIKTYLTTLALLAAPLPAAAQDFDYYLLSLTWTPSFCAAEGDAEDREQCDPGRDLGFTVHGLWPQYEEGWPEFCDATVRDPSRGQTGDMADIMGSGGLAWYQWRKHGRCTGLPAAEYFRDTRAAFAGLQVPRIRDERITEAEVEAAFLAANPALRPNAVIVTCRDGLVREVRICLTPGLAPRACGADVLRAACRARGDLSLPPIP